MNHLETAADAVEVFRTLTFDAPHTLVRKVWTEVEHRNQWWGRPGFTTVCELDLRPGGKGTVEEVIVNEPLVISDMLEMNGVAAFNP